MAAGAEHSLALKDGGVISWGALTDVPADASSGVTAIAAGDDFSLALKGDRVIAWNDDGSLLGPPSTSSGVTAIAAGDDYALSLKDGGVIWWFPGGTGQGVLPAEWSSGITAIAAGDHHQLAVTGGKVIARGDDWEGETNVPDEALSGVSAVAAGRYHSMALKGGRVLAWGYDYAGLVTGIPREALSGVSAIAAGHYHSMALRDGRVIAWGYDYFGQIQVPYEAASHVTAIAAGGDHSLALRTYTVPSAPRSLETTSDIRSLKVRWTPPDDDGGTPVTGYRAFTNTGASCTPDTDWDGRLATDCTIFGLADGTDYSVSVSASNRVGEGEAASVSGHTLDIPSPPQNVTITPRVRGLDVSWMPPSADGGMGISAYHAETDTGAACETTEALGCAIKGLSDGRRYEVRVWASNGVGRSASASAWAFTARPLSARILSFAAPRALQLLGARIQLSGKAVLRYSNGDSAALRGTRVRLQFRKHGRRPWSTLATRRTSSSGRVRIRGRITGDGHWRLVAPSAGAMSRAVYVDALSRPRVSMRAETRRTTWGEWVALRGKVTAVTDKGSRVAVPSGQDVAVQFRPSGHTAWWTTETIRTGRRGIAGTLVRARRSGSWRMRVAGGTSAARRIMVMPRYRLSVAWPSSIWGSFRVQARVTRNGRPYPTRFEISHRFSTYDSWTKIDYSRSTRRRPAVLLVSFGDPGYYAVCAPAVRRCEYVSYA